MDYKHKNFEREKGLSFKSLKTWCKDLEHKSYLINKLSHKQGSQMKEELIFHIPNEIKFNWVRKGGKLKVISGKRDGGNP